LAITQQRLHGINIKSLKNIKDLDISFEPHYLTAILGPNGCGKSTILHALAAAFSPNINGENNKFSFYFLPNTHALWNGSKFKITYSYREDRVEFKQLIREYGKSRTRWAPRYANRPKRDVYYIGIQKCVPMIESENQTARLNYTTQVLASETVEQILAKASHIFNKHYTALNSHTASRRRFLGVVSDDLTYSALSMSAGEQKVFYLLDKIFNAEQYSLFLIDEIDLLLHDAALQRLLDVLAERCAAKKIQVIFTTHRESVLERDSVVNIRHIYNTPTKTLCFNDTKPEALTRLNGRAQRTLDLFVEDDLSETIVNKLTSVARLLKYSTVTKFGAAVNCFTIIGGLSLSRTMTDNSIFIMDGDVYRSEDEKQEQLNRVLTGHDANAINLRATALRSILEWQLPERTAPEYYINRAISRLNIPTEHELFEVYEAVSSINAVRDNHEWLNEPLDILGVNRKIGLSKIIELFSLTPEWTTFTANVSNWLNIKAQELLEP
jgi:AAA15 family ATPase/GTPase